MFKGPICGSNSYSLSTRVHNVFKCDGCSSIFEEPSKFGKVHKEEYEVIEDNEGVHISIKGQ